MFAVRRAVHLMPSELRTRPVRMRKSGCWFDKSSFHRDPEGGRGLYFLKKALLGPYYRYYGPLPPPPPTPVNIPKKFHGTHARDSGLYPSRQGFRV